MASEPGSGPGVELLRLDRDEHFARAASHQKECAAVGLLQRIRELVPVPDSLLVDFEDHVALTQARFVRR